MKKRSLISITDLTHRDVERILSLAAEVKASPEAFGKKLSRKMFGLIFEKPSTRTWVSFETGIFSLGGSAIYLGPQDIKLGVREEVKDVARVLDRYLSGVIMRTFAHETIIEFCRYFKGPVINGLSDHEHPCQALGDFLTLREKFPSVKRPVLAFVGDGNNVLNSLMLLTAITGGELAYAAPAGYDPPKSVVAETMRLARKSKARIKAYRKPEDAVRKAHVVYADVWVSMGQEKARKRKLRDFKGFQVNNALLKKASKEACVMHCLPAHRGEEITDEVLEGRRSIVFDQAENRLHIQKAILLYLCQK